MKKILVTILAIVYLSGALGATIHLHYCMGKLASWGLAAHAGNTCMHCGMAKKNHHNHGIGGKPDCCRDEHKIIQTVTDQKFSAALNYSLSNLFFTGLNQRLDTQIPSLVSAITVSFETHSPPGSEYICRTIFSCNFRI